MLLGRDMEEHQSLAWELYVRSGCSCTSLRKASRRISQLYDLALAPSGLKTTQRAILLEISRTEPTTIRALAQELAMDATGLGHTLKPLSRDRLIDVSVDQNEKRCRRVTLTPAGRAKLIETNALWAQAQRGFETVFLGAQSHAFRDALQALATAEFADAFKTTLSPRPR